MTAAQSVADIEKFVRDYDLPLVSRDNGQREEDIPAYRADVCQDKKSAQKPRLTAK